MNFYLHRDENLPLSGGVLIRPRFRWHDGILWLDLYPGVVDKRGRKPWLQNENIVDYLSILA